MRFLMAGGEVQMDVVLGWLMMRKDVLGHG